MALESRLVEVTNMLRAERARASQLEQRTSRLETQLLTFKAMVLDVMRQSIQLLEKRLAVDEAANSSVLVPPMTASSLIEKKSPAEDHSEERGIKMEDSYQNLRNVGIKRHTWTDPTADALDELEQDLKARILSVDRRRDFSNKDTTAGADALRGWDTGQGNNGEDNGGWAISSYDANNKNDRQDTDTGFAMPRSINQIMGKKPVSARNKVLSWQKNTAIGSAEPTDGETANGHTRAVSESTNDDMNDITDIHNIEGRSDTSTDNHPRVQESIPFASASGYDDDDEGGDDEDPLACLGSRTFQAEKAMSLLFDSADTPLTTERLAHLWRASAWIPFDDLPVLYERHYKTELWTHDTRKKTRLYLPKLPGISERQSCNNYKQCMLLFMDGGHLKNAKAYQRVFVRPWIAEPALFFFLTTSVYWPLEYEQAEIIRKMWENEFHHTPVGLVTVKCSDRFEERKWFVMEMLWRSAVDWLKELAQAVINLGCKYMLNKLSSWDDTANISVYMNQNQRSSTMPRDPDADIVYGLSRDELLEVIKMALVLLQTKISDVDILRLEDELLQPM
ncbi:hypothetical protein EV178_003516 [Coemansia sp. RSA 1646]|nr:hypothetical protein EV178_003516 [Coemansia sp. RSA 1646]